MNVLLTIYERTKLLNFGNQGYHNVSKCVEWLISILENDKFGSLNKYLRMHIYGECPYKELWSKMFIFRVIVF